MSQYFYNARNNSQELIEGTIDADNLDQAVGKIVSAGLFPFTVKELQKNSAQKILSPEAGLQERNRFWLNTVKTRRIPRRQIATFTQQLSDLTGSGVALATALHIVSRQTRHNRFKSIIEDVSTFIEDGGSFADALGRRPDIFSDVYVNLVKSGEMSGRLSEILNRLADLTQREFEDRKSVV